MCRGLSLVRFVNGAGISVKLRIGTGFSTNLGKRGRANFSDKAPGNSVDCFEYNVMVMRSFEVTPRPKTCATLTDNYLVHFPARVNVCFDSEMKDPERSARGDLFTCAP